VSLVIPTVTEQTPKGERLVDLFSRLLGSRIVFLGVPIDDASVNLVIAQLLHLDADRPGQDIFLYLNSPGGDMTGLFAIYDTMQFLVSEVSTVCVGQACSGAAVLLAAGAKGKRYVLPNARVLIHQPHGGAQGQSSDLERAVAEMVEMRRRMVRILADHTGQTEERVTADIDRDYILRGDDVVTYGLADEVITTRAIQAPTP
jgi:ATP-dependent Clp protease protease subunit